MSKWVRAESTLEASSGGGGRRMLTDWFEGPFAPLGSSEMRAACRRSRSSFRERQKGRSTESEG